MYLWSIYLVPRLVFSKPCYSALRILVHLTKSFDSTAALQPPRRQLLPVRLLAAFPILLRPPALLLCSCSSGGKDNSCCNTRSPNTPLPVPLRPEGLENFVIACQGPTPLSLDRHSILLPEVLGAVSFIRSVANLQPPPRAPTAYLPPEGAQDYPPPPSAACRLNSPSSHRSHAWWVGSWL